MNATLTQLERSVGHPPPGTVDTLLAERVVDLLNDLLRLDRLAIEQLVETRVRCNAALAAHPTVPVLAAKDGEGGLLGLLGVLNGLMGVWDEESAPQPHLAFFGPVAARYDREGRLTGFMLSTDTKAPQ